MRILLIEDNPGDARLIREMLKEADLLFDMETAHSLSTGIGALGTDRYDVVLLDLGLPESQGIDTLERLKEYVPETPVIVLTGLADDAVGMAAVHAGAQDYLIKGDTTKELLVRSIWYAIERKRYEGQLKEIGAKYKSLFDSTMDGIYRSDEKAAFAIANKACAGIFGYLSPEELIGRPLLDCWYDPEEGQKFVEEMKKAGSVRLYPIKARNRRGEVIYLETSSHIVEDGHGNFAGFEGILRDITEHRKLEAQLLQAQKMEAVGQLAAGIAHDFNNILGAMVNYLHLLRVQAPDSVHVREFSEQMLKLTDRASNLTQGLLAFSRKRETRTVAVDLNGIVGRARTLFQRVLGEDIEIVLDAGREHFIVMADPLQIEQLLMNLASNSRDAMPRGGSIRISTGIENIDQLFIQSHGYGAPGPYAVISFSDTGTGMDEETRKRIFEPFFTTKEVGRGTGLGLAMAYGIVKQHNGYITAYSEPGQGTTFRIYLPLAADLSEDPGEAPAPEVPSGRGELILLAEDEEMVRITTARVLTDFHYRVLTARDGQEALERFIEHAGEIALALLDVIMPKKNGMDVADEIRKVRPGLPVLFMSGYPERAGHHRQILSDTDICLTKPVAPARLLARIREMLDQPGG